MKSPLDSPEGDWWSESINRRESIWLGIAGIWSILIFGWMSAYTRIGAQNPIGQTYRVDAAGYHEKMNDYLAQATETDNGIIPAESDVFIGARRFDWQGTPVTLEANREYDIHLSSYDVQHGFSIRPEETLSKQISLQVLPGYEWVIPMTFDEPGDYHVICNEFCGVGHRTMHGRIHVIEE